MSEISELKSVALLKFFEKKKNANNPEGKKEGKQTKQTSKCRLKIQRFHRKKGDMENSRA